MQPGWIKLHRRLLDWEWYGDHNVARLFIHLLLTVNYEDSTWRGMPIAAGQIATGRNSLSTETGLSESQVRTTLKKLVMTSDIAITQHKDCSIITVLNWLSYQQDDQQIDQQNSQQNDQRVDRKIATIDKKIRSKKKESIPPTPESDFLEGLPLPEPEPQTPEQLKLEEFVQHRKELKKPFTKKGKSIFIKRLNELHEDGHDTIELMDYAMERNWLTVYPPKDD